jgi:DNA-binding CsgD family transcriptional regulator
VLVSPLRGEQAEPAWTVPPVALVILRAPEDVPMPSQAELRSLFALTPAEARVACLLPERTVEEIARDLGVRVATVRSHVQQLLSKTGARRQSELVRLLVSGPWLGG